MAIQSLEILHTNKDIWPEDCARGKLVNFGKSLSSGEHKGAQ